MMTNALSSLRIERYLELLTILLFTELVTLLFLSIPANFLQNNVVLLSFYLLFLIYFLITLIIPWLYFFFSTNRKQYVFLIFISISFFIVFLIANLVVKIPLQVIIYFIILKSITAGFALIFKTIYTLFENETERKHTKFQFSISNEGLNDTSNKNFVYKWYKNDILGGLVLLVVYPFIILLLTYFYSFIHKIFI